MATKAQRAKLHELMEFTALHAAQLDYPTGDVRGARDAATWAMSEAEMRTRLTAGKRLQFDCSQAATQLCRWAGLKDPNGLGYKWAGYTGTMLAHLSHYTNPKVAQIGALVVYGPGTGEHVSMVMEPGADPLVWSHGRAGVDLVRFSRQRTWHRPPVTFCAIAKL